MPERDRILLVEDDPDGLEALYVVLTRAGFAVTPAVNGQQALNLLEHGQHPQVIILDLMMPRVSGWDVLKVLQADPVWRRIPIVVTTAVIGSHAKVVADAVIHKPIKHDELLAIVRHLIDKHTQDIAASPTNDRHRSS